MEDNKDKVLVRFVFKSREFPQNLRIDRDGSWEQALKDESSSIEGLVDGELFSRICNHPLVHIEFLSNENIYVLDTMQMDIFDPLYLKVTQFFPKYDSLIKIRGAKESRIVVSFMRDDPGLRLEKSPRQASLETLLRNFERDLPKIPCKSMESYICKKLSTLLQEASFDLNGEDFEAIALKLGEGIYKALEPIQNRIEYLLWQQMSSDEDEIQDGGYKFRAKGVFHLECQRLAFYVLHGLILERFPEFGLGIQLMNNKWNKILDLSFIGKRKMGEPIKVTKEQEESTELVPNPSAMDPGLPHKALDYLDELTTYALNKEHDFWENQSGSEICVSTLILMDYASRLGDPDLSHWDIETFCRFMREPEFRVACMRPIPTEYFHQNTPLDTSTNYWIKKFKTLSENRVGILVKKASDLLHSFEFYNQAMKKGFSDQEVIIYSKDELKKIEGKIQKHADTKGGEYYRHWRSYLDIFTENGPVRYFALAKTDLDWNEIDKIHPNFSKVTSFVRRLVKLSSRAKNGALSLPPILLVGNPGVGKTFYASMLAKLLGTEYYEIAMSSMTAGFILSGLDLSWANGRPGQVAEALSHGYCANPLVILDEIDKVGGDKKHDPLGPLYQLLEKHTASKYQDEALRIKMNVSNFLWFATANSIQDIPDPIISRFEVIQIPDLTPEEIPAVANSIYSKIREDHPWGEAFAENLPSSIYKKLEGFSARDMFKMIRRACATASDRSNEDSLTIQPEDFEVVDTAKQKMGF